MFRDVCLICQEETAAGSPRYSDRKVITRGSERAYVCADCAARSRPERQHELTPEERERLEASAAVFGGWWSVGPIGPF